MEAINELPTAEKKIEFAHPGKRYQGQFADGVVAVFFGYSLFYVVDFFVTRDLAVYIGLAVGILYFLLCDALPNGQSVGKLLLNIQVVGKKTLIPCSVTQSFFRNITFPLGVLDWIFIFFGEHRRLGDFIASTIVVKKKK
jgi:uncharacterized RDD family membrane protein YckC